MKILFGDMVLALEGADFVRSASPTGLRRFETETAGQADILVRVVCGGEHARVWSRSDLLGFSVGENSARYHLERTEGTLELDVPAATAEVRLRGPWVRGVESLLSTALQIYALATGRGAVLHASCVERHGRAYAFTGSSGAGKSTAAFFAVERGARVLAEDLTYVRLADDGRAEVCTLPFWQRGGTEPEPERVPLRLVCFLHQAPADRVVSLDVAQQIRRVLRVVSIGVRCRPTMLAALDAAPRLVASVPVVDLHFRKSNAFWDHLEGHGTD